MNADAGFDVVLVLPSSYLSLGFTVRIEVCPRVPVSQEQCLQQALSGALCEGRARPQVDVVWVGVPLLRGGVCYSCFDKVASVCSQVNGVHQPPCRCDTSRLQLGVVE